MDEPTTTIRVRKSTLEKIEELKIHPRQTYDEVIADCIKSQEKVITVESKPFGKSLQTTTPYYQDQGYLGSSSLTPSINTLDLST